MTQKEKDNWFPPEGAKVTLMTSFKPQRNTMSIPSNDDKHKKISSQRRFNYTYHIIFLWICFFCLFLFILFIFLKINTNISQINNSASTDNFKNELKNVKVYPFNIYDDTKDRTVRYPSTGGIQDLDWNTVRFFRVCCKDEDHLKCFAANEVTLRRDNERTVKKIPDVYMEVKHSTSTNVAEIGSRCHLIWSMEKGQTEN
jgi:hypothetical protein